MTVENIHSYSSLTVIPAYSFNKKELFLKKQKAYFLSVTISSSDIKKEISSDFFPFLQDKNNKIQINDIPVGIDRIITVKAFDSEKKELPSLQMRAVISIKEDEAQNLVTVSEKTSTFGNVLYEIKNTFDFEEIEKDGRMDLIRKVMDENIPPCLYNSSRLIGELKGFSFPHNFTSEDYRLQPGSLKTSYLLSNNFTLFLNDPMSEVQKSLKASDRLEIQGISPGKWTLTLTDSSGNILESQKDIKIESGKCSDIGHIEHKGRALLVPAGKLSKNSKEFKFLQFSALSEAKEKKEISYKNPLELKEKIFLKEAIEEASEREREYYLYNFQEEDIQFSITDSAQISDCKYGNKEFQISEKGIYLLDQGILKKLSREISSAPIDQLLPLINEDNFRKCFIDDPKNSRFVLLFSEKLYGKKAESVKALFNRGINDLYGKYTGSSYTLKKEGADFWQTSVPYRDIQSTNQSGQPSYNFEIDDKVIEAPSFVPDGYIYQKFDGIIEGKKFLCLIYSYQDEKLITRRLSQAKHKKTLKDFDLKSDKGKREIANFRLVPGTENLYRSFHPYSDDKKSVSGQEMSRERIKALTSLAEKAGIKADINLSDTEVTKASWEMPAYYQSIIDNDKVLYMTDCSYNICYEEPENPVFAEGMKKIIRFINREEGPFLIHCRIGTDRTGVTCAVLAALCGASIEEIEKDYTDSIEMGIFEYRGSGAVRYSLEKILQVTFIEEAGNLQEAVKNYFIKNNYLSAEEIENCIKKLKSH